MSPDGRTVAVGGHGAFIRLWDIKKGQEATRLHGHKETVDSVAFSPDGKLLASGGRDKTARLWEVATGKEIRSLGGHEHFVAAVAFSPDAKILATGGSFDTSVRLWETATGKAVRMLTGDPDPLGILAVAFTPDGKTLAAAGGIDKIIRLWNPATGKELRRLEGHENFVGSLAFSPDGKVLASAAVGMRNKRLVAGEVRLWEMASGKELPRLEASEGPFQGIAFSPDGTTLAAGGSEYNFIRLWNLATRKERFRSGHQGSVWPLAFAPDGRTLLTGSEAEQTLRLWDARTGRVRQAVTGSGAAFFPQGKKLLVLGGGKDPTLRAFDLATGQLTRPVSFRGSESLFALAPDGKCFVTADKDGVIRVCDGTTGKELRCLAGKHGDVGSLAFSPDGKLVAVAGGDGIIRLMDTNTGTQRGALTGNSEPAHCLSFAPDGRLLASACFILRGGPVRVWDVARSREVCQLSIPQPGEMRTDFWCVAFSADGRALATAGWDSAVYLWEAETGKQRGVFTGHQGPVMALAFSPDGTRLVSGGVDTTALVWDLTAEHARKADAAPLTPSELQTLWADLAAADAEQAYRAIQVLGRSAQAVTLFKEKLRPVVPLDPKRQARLLADLDSNRFAVRRKAAQELDGLGEPAAAALRQFLTHPPSPEARLRAEQILERLDREATTAHLRTVRAFEALERLGTSEARELLRSLAKGAAHARQTEEAKGSLARLAQRERSAKR